MKNECICGENCPNYKYIDKSKLHEPTISNIQQISEMFKIFSDATRLKIITTLLNNEFTVSELCEKLQINQTTLSHQLKILRDTKLVKYKKEGKQVYYSLTDAHVEQIILQALDHILE